jgi:predicted RNA methylase
MFTRTALARGPSLVIAIEPAPRTLDALRRNLQSEIREGRVVVYPKGAWDHDSEMELSVNDALQINDTLVCRGNPPAPKFVCRLPRLIRLSPN